MDHINLGKDLVLEVHYKVVNYTKKLINHGIRVKRDYDHSADSISDGMPLTLTMIIFLIFFFCFSLLFVIPRQRCIIRQVFMKELL